MNKSKTKHKAFSLVELMVAMSIFFLVITTSTAVFANIMNTKKKTKNTQKNIEDMKYAIELMTKNIRMSSNIGGSSSVVYTHNNSQDKCVSYRFSASNKLETLETAIPGGIPENCNLAGTYPSASYVPMVSGDINASESRFDITPSTSNLVGKVVILISITSGSGSSNDAVKLQTVASLRDYK